MKFEDLKEGMKVYIKDDLAQGEEYGNDKFIIGMPTKICTVKSVCRVTNKFKICEDMDFWNYTPEMVDWDRTEDLNNPKKADSIRPGHYMLSIDGFDFEVRDVMKASMSDLEYKGFLYGNILKYILRAFKKNGVEDLEKAKQYLEWLVEEEKTNENR